MNTTPAPASGSPSGFLAVDGKAYFAAAQPGSGTEVFVTDGTEAGTRLLADMVPGSQSSDPAALGVAGDYLIVRAGAFDDRQIWSVRRSSGIALQLTYDVRPGSEPASWTRAVATTAGRLLLTIGSDSGFWSTDGTVAGTFRLPTDANFPLLSAWAACSDSQRAIVVGGTGSFEAVIAATDGTSAGSRVLATVPFVSGASTLRVGERCYMLLHSASSASWALWSSDGTAAGTVRVTGEQWYGLSMAAIGDALYIGERALEQNRARLVRVSLVTPTPEPEPVVEFSGSDSYVHSLQEIEGKLLFLQRSGGARDSLYLSDGTLGGTRKVFPLSPAQSFRTTTLRSVPGAVVINESQGRLRLDLATGVLTPGPPADNFFHEDIVRLGAYLVGPGRDEQAGEELWHSDGTLLGTRLLKDLYPATADGLAFGQSRDWAVVDDVLVYAGYYEPRSGGAPGRRGILRSDGTAAGTHELPRNGYDENTVYGLGILGNEVFFGTIDGVSTTLYRTDAGLQTAALFAQGVTRWSGSQPFGVGKMVFGCGGLFPEAPLCMYSAKDGIIGIGPLASPFDGSVGPFGRIGGLALVLDDSTRVWRSDGTAPGTFALPVRADLAEASEAEFSGKLYLRGCVDNVGCGVVSTDGTVKGTGLLADLGNGYATSIVALPSRIVFAVRALPAGVAELWSSDGSAAGTHRVASLGLYSPSTLAVVEGKVHVAAQPCDSCSGGYYISDGTAAGTYTVELPSGLTARPSVMARLADGTIVFGCHSAARGTELCAADPDGTEVVPLPEIVQGSGSPLYVDALGASSTGLFLAVDDLQHGRELWFIRPLPVTIFRDGFDVLPRVD